MNGEKISRDRPVYVWQTLSNFYGLNCLSIKRKSYNNNRSIESKNFHFDIKIKFFYCYCCESKMIMIICIKYRPDGIQWTRKKYAYKISLLLFLWKKDSLFIISRLILAEENWKKATTKSVTKSSSNAWRKGIRKL